MKKLFLVLVAIALVASFASAQDIWGEGKMSVGVGAELALPMGDFGDLSGVGFGGAAAFQYGVTNDLLLTGTFAYTQFTAKETDWAKGNIVSIVAGGKYNLSGQAQPGLYALAQVGIGISGSDAPNSESTTNLAFAPGIGYQLNNLDFSVKYLVVDTDIISSSALVLNVSYVFPL
jgi:hypothetical protein